MEGDTPTPAEELVEHESDGLTGSVHEEQSLLDKLKDKRRQIGLDRHLDLDLPGYDGELVVRYRPTPTIWDDLKKIAEKVNKSKNPRKELLGQADTLVLTCEQIFLKQEGNLTPLQEVIGDTDGEPVRFDHRLAEIVGLEGDPGSARLVVLGVFNNDLAVTAQHNEVAQWLQSSRQEDDADF